jgi:hypothetical protein
LSTEFAGSRAPHDTIGEGQNLLWFSCFAVGNFTRQFGSILLGWKFSKEIVPFVGLLTIHGEGFTAAFRFPSSKMNAA